MRRSTRVDLTMLRRLALVLLLLVGMAVVPLAGEADALPEGFREDVVVSGLNNPTKVLFARDGRVFVAEKSGLVKTFDGLADATPTVFADLRTQVHNFWDRGLLGLVLHPDFPADPRVYVLYTHDAEPGGTAPRWGSPGGTSDPCPSPPGATADGCVVTGRLSVLTDAGGTAGAEQVLIEDWCQQYPSHSVGDLAFGADGALYVSAGDGASFNFADWGQDGTPTNPCGDPPAGVEGAQTPPTAEGGALRSQDVRTPSDPTGLDGTVLRLDPDTGAALPDNPSAGATDANVRRIVAHGLRNPFRFTIRPGTSEVWLGDVGWSSWEEIDRIADPTAHRPSGASDTAQLTVSADNTAPSVSIDTPGPSLVWAVGDQIDFSGSATDAQDSTVTDLTWEIRLHHCVTPDECHVHTIRTVDGTSGTETAPDHEYPSWLELRVTATDSGGLTDTASLRLDPQTTQLTVETDPPGLTVGLGDDSGPGPLTGEVIVGSSNSVSAPSPQTVDGTTYEFQSWSDGGAASHNVTAPTGPTTLTATYAEVAPPTAFDARDIGAPALSGSTTQDDADTFTVVGAGADIWGTSDQFHYASQPLTGDGSIAARVVSQTVTNPWAKAGVMIRDGFGANARHAMLVQTPGNGVAFQRRTVTGGSSLHTAGPSVSPPQWVKLVRIGDALTGYTSTDAATWTQVGTATIAMGADVRIGLAVTSHSTGARSTAVFDNVVIGAADPPPPPPPVTCAPGQWAVDYFANRTVSGDPVLRRCEDAIDHDWGSGGPGGGLPFDDFSARWTRTVDFADGTHQFTARADDGVRVFVDDDLIIDAWKDQAATTYTATRDLAGTHDVVMEYYERGGQAVARLDWTTTPAGTTDLDGADVGGPALAGSTTGARDDWTVTGGGADIWGVSDQFQYGNTPLSGDGSITARVVSQTNTDVWAKAGVMIRESLAPGSRHAMVVVTPGNGTAYQCRLTPGASSLHTAGPGWSTPAWVRIERQGDVVVGAVSTDGQTWSEVSRRTVAMGPDVLVGLAVTSHNNATTSTAEFTDVTVTP